MSTVLARPSTDLPESPLSHEGNAPSYEPSPTDPGHLADVTLFMKDGRLVMIGYKLCNYEAHQITCVEDGARNAWEWLFRAMDVSLAAAYMRDVTEGRGLRL